MKKVCHISSVHKLNDIRILHKQCASLAEAGYDVTLVACELPEKISYPGIRLVGLNTKGSRLSRMLFRSLKAYRIARSLRADIYHFHDPELLPYGLLLKKTTNAAVVYDSHECYPEDFLTKEWLPAWFRKIASWGIRFLENAVVRRIDFVIAATSHITERFRPVTVRVATINNYPLREEFLDVSDDHNEEAKDGFCYVGAISEVRGILPLMDALDSIAPSVRFYLAGTFADQKIESKVKNHRNWHRVTFLGQVSRKEIADIYRRSFAGVVNFLPAPNHNFSQPNKLFEYMSAGIPTICSNFYLWENIVKKGCCGVCVNPSSSKELAAAINQLSEDMKLRIQFSKNAIRLTQALYCWDFEAENLLRVYGDILYEA